MNPQNAPTEPITKARRATSATTNRMPCVHGRNQVKTVTMPYRFLAGFLGLIAHLAVSK